MKYTKELDEKGVLTIKLCTDFYGKSLIKLDETIALWPGATALHWASYGGFDLTVKELIRQKVEFNNGEVDFNAKDNSLFQTPICLACS